MTASPLASASLADWRAIFSVWAGVVGVLLDVGGHLLHRGRGLFGRRGLLGRARLSCSAVADILLRTGRDVLGRGDGVGHDVAQALDHGRAQCRACPCQSGLGIDHEVPPAISSARAAVLRRFCVITVGGLDQILDLVLSDFDALVDAAWRRR